jgi:peptidoglycan-associated lipoprotein
MHRNLRWTLVVPVVVLALAAGGCSKKKTPVTAEEMPVEVERMSAMDSAPAPSSPSRTETSSDIWSADLDTLNAYVREQGLLQTVYFDFDQADLRNDTREKLAGNARFLGEHPELVVAIEGHADERGTGEYNLALGDRRANTTQSYLGSLGVSGDRLRAISYGEERPECVESVENCWWKNRRAQFVIVGRR